MRKSSEGKRSGSKGRGQTRNLIGDEETTIGIEIVIETRTNVAGALTKTRAVMTRAVIGKDVSPQSSVASNVEINIKRRMDARAYQQLINLTETFSLQKFWA